LEMKQREEERQAAHVKWEEGQQSWDEERTQGSGLVEECDKELVDARSERTRLVLMVVELQSEMKQREEERRAEQGEWEEERQSWDEATTQLVWLVEEREKEHLEAETMRLESVIYEIEKERQEEKKLRFKQMQTEKKARIRLEVRIHDLKAQNEEAREQGREEEKRERELTEQR